MSWMTMHAMRIIKSNEFIANTIHSKCIFVSLTNQFVARAARHMAVMMYYTKYINNTIIS